LLLLATSIRPVENELLLHPEFCERRGAVDFTKQGGNMKKKTWITLTACASAATLALALPLGVEGGEIKTNSLCAEGDRMCCPYQGETCPGAREGVWEANAISCWPE
jgi:hypothetical protein